MFDISILGGGWVGVPLAENLAQKGYLVQISQSSQTQSIQNKAIHVEAWRADVNLSQQAWEPILQAKILIWTIPPRRKQHGDTFYLDVLTDFVRLVNQRKYQQVIFLSSTSIYKSENKAVDEESPVEFNLMNQAEQLINQIKSPVLILRLGGLMGGERYVAKYYAGKQVPAANHLVNYVHRSDVLQIIHGCIQVSLADTCNVVAPLHPVKADLVKEECQRRKLNMPLDYIESSEPMKWVSSQKIIQALNYTFQYPDPMLFPIEN